MVAPSRDVAALADLLTAQVEAQQLDGVGGPRRIQHPRELRGVIATLDPGPWLDRAADAERPGRREALVAVARGLERMAPREVLLHTLRLALIHRICLLATTIPDFSPRLGVTRMIVEARILQLDIHATLDILAQVFLAKPDPAAERDYFEPRGPRATDAYVREDAEIFEAIRRLFGQIREIATAITHEVGALG